MIGSAAVDYFRISADFKWVSDDLLGTALHPMGTDSFGPDVGHLHPHVVKLPKVLSLEEVRLAVNILEGRVNVPRNTAPHGNVTWIIQLNMAN